MKDDQIRNLLRAGRKSRSQGGVIGAHIDASGIAMPQSGDRDAPFTKLNPFVTAAESYWADVALPNAETSYIDGPIIDVTAWRTLIVYVTCDGQCSLLPQAAPDLEVDAGAVDVFLNPDRTPLLPIGVIDPALTVITVPGTTAAYASRTMYGTELRNPADTVLRVSLSFDVTMFSAFNFRAAEIDPGEVPALISLNYALSM